jgi:hypothetical protein
MSRRLQEKRIFIIIIKTKGKEKRKKREITSRGALYHI